LSSGADEDSREHSCASLSRVLELCFRWRWHGVVEKTSARVAMLFECSTFPFYLFRISSYCGLNSGPNGYGLSNSHIRNHFENCTLLARAFTGHPTGNCVLTSIRLSMVRSIPGCSGCQASSLRRSDGGLTVSRCQGHRTCRGRGKEYVRSQFCRFGKIVCLPARAVRGSDSYG